MGTKDPSHLAWWRTSRLSGTTQFWYVAQRAMKISHNSVFKMLGYDSPKIILYRACAGKGLQCTPCSELASADLRQGDVAPAAQGFFWQTVPVISCSNRTVCWGRAKQNKTKINKNPNNNRHHQDFLAVTFTHWHNLFIALLSESSRLTPTSRPEPRLDRKTKEKYAQQCHCRVTNVQKQPYGDTIFLGLTYMCLKKDPQGAYYSVL